MSKNFAVFLPIMSAIFQLIWKYFKMKKQDTLVEKSELGTCQLLAKFKSEIYAGLPNPVTRVSNGMAGGADLIL